MKLLSKSPFGANPVRTKNKKSEIDPEFFKAIQPRYNLKFAERAIKKGDGYEACIHVYAYPRQSEIFWLEDICMRENTIVTIDIASLDEEKVKKDLRESMREDRGNYNDTNDDTVLIDSQTSYNEMQQLYAEITQEGELIKAVHARIFTFAKTLQKLEEQADNIITDLESKGYKLGIFLNEAEYEYKSLYLPFEKQQEMKNRHEANPIPTVSLSAGYPFNYESHRDPHGFYLGYIPGGGACLFDNFHNDRYFKAPTKARISYDIFIGGKKGSGKSTLLKKLTTFNIALGNKVRGIAVSNEFDLLIQKFDGKMISMDGSNGIQNLLEIQSTMVDKETNQLDDVANFSQHLSKLSVFYAYMSPEAESSEIKEFEQLCRRLYIKHNLWSEKPGESKKNTGLHPKDYPIFTDLLNLVQDEIYSDKVKRIVKKEISETRLNRLEKIELVLQTVTSSYGHIFNGHTSFPNLDDEQIVFYDLRGVTKLQNDIKHAVMFNVLSIFWGAMLKTGLAQKMMWEEREIEWEDIERIFLVIDEAHIIIGSGNKGLLEYVVSFLRETRKYFTGLAMATQDIRDVIPEGANTEHLDLLKKIFAQTQYKFVFRQDESSIPLIRDLFGNNITEGGVSSVSKLGQGVCLYSDDIASKFIKIEISDKEDDLYRGGA